jgi:hypothetical protein
MKENRSPDENLIHKLAANKLFRKVSLAQLCIHLCAYIASFIKLIIIEAGGYYDVSILAFLGITTGAMPLFAIAWWLIQHSLKLAQSGRTWGYCFNGGVCLWCIWIVKISYFGQ